MSLLRINELEAQLQRRDERIAGLDAANMALQRGAEGLLLQLEQTEQKWKAACDIARIAEAQLEAVGANWKDAARKIAIEIAKNCGSVPQLVFPHLYLGLKDLFDVPEVACAQPAQQSEPVRVPMTDEQIQQGAVYCLVDDYLDFHAGVKTAELHHGITSKAEGAQQDFDETQPR